MRSSTSCARRAAVGRTCACGARRCGWRSISSGTSPRSSGMPRAVRSISAAGAWVRSRRRFRRCSRRASWPSPAGGGRATSRRPARRASRCSIRSAAPARWSSRARRSPPAWRRVSGARGGRPTGSSGFATAIARWPRASSRRSRHGLGRRRAIRHPGHFRRAISIHERSRPRGPAPARRASRHASRSSSATSRTRVRRLPAASWSRILPTANGCRSPGRARCCGGSATGSCSAAGARGRRSSPPTRRRSSTSVYAPAGAFPS